MLRRLTVSVLLCLLLVSVSYGEMLYGVHPYDGDFLKIDSTTGAATAVGPTGFSLPSDLTTDSNGTLYSIGGNAGSSAVNDQLVTIDKLTGAATVVAPVPSIQAIAFDSHDTLFGVLNPTDNPAEDVFVTIDTTTGFQTPIGPLGFSIIGGLAFDSSDTLYGVDFLGEQLVTINTTTGAATAIGSFGGSYVTDLSFSNNGELFGSELRTDQLVTINADTGFATPVGPFGIVTNGYVSGIAFSSVPEPTSFLMFGIAMLGLSRRRRRR